MKFTFPKSARLRFSRQFQECERLGEKRVGTFLVVHLHYRREKNEPRLGLTVTRHFGSAVRRNRFKRKAKEIFRHLKHQLPGNLWLVVKPRPSAQRLSLSEMQKELNKLLLICAKQGEPACEYTPPSAQSPRVCQMAPSSLPSPRA